MPTDPTAGDVTADMERIFKPLAGRALVPAFHHDVRHRRGRVGRGWRQVALIAPAAVLVVVATLAIGYGRANGPTARMSEATVTTLLPPASVRSPIVSSYPPAPIPSITAPTSLVDFSAVASRPTTDPRPMADPRPVADPIPSPSPASLGVPSGGARARPSGLAPKPRPIEAARPSRPASGPRSARADTVASVAFRRRERAGSSIAMARCAPGSLEDRCIYQDVLNADARLRVAYDAAKRDGVSKLWLSAVSRRWNQAWKKSEDDPDGTISRYRQLADALDEERREVAR
ncbi:hypothetical protein [uncultured Sphingomonas sp.]|uniref:hypothetical protein n=1 Tax=uncultured Sphingomonas sp. TaxID=158754 RepID=UPI0035CA9BAF